MLLRMEMEAPRDVTCKGKSEWDVMKMIDKWGAKRKRMLFSSRKEKPAETKVTDKLGGGVQRERGRILSDRRRTDMNSLMGSAQPRKSLSLTQSDSRPVTHR